MPMNSLFSEMQEKIDGMAIAERVLTAVNNIKPADIGEIAYLRRHAPLSSDLPLDELACAVIHQGTRRRTGVARLLHVPPELRAQARVLLHGL